MNLDEKLLFEYVKTGDLEGVRKLLDFGINVCISDNSALRRASENGYVRIVELLLEHGADVHDLNDSALRWASDQGHVEVVDALLKNSADVHARDDEALYWACCNGYVGVAIKLVEAGANLRDLKNYWVKLFGCKAPASLVKMSVGEVVELVIAEAIGCELV